MTTKTTERKLLQVAIVLACFVPLSTGGAGILFGPKAFSETLVYIPLDNHFRYLSGLLFAIGLGFLTCVKHIELRTERVRVLGGLVIIGGLARLYGVIAVGNPGAMMLGGLGIELILVPLLLVWQARITRQALV